MAESLGSMVPSETPLGQAARVIGCLHSYEQAADPVSELALDRSMLSAVSE